MRYQQPLKQILNASREQWDDAEIRLPVRENFAKVTLCRTSALGAEVYASETEEKVVPHTCKSRSCPSCGHRATILWQREQWASLPDVPYMGINFTMPDVLWPIFRDNRHLLHDLPALAGAVIKQYLKTRHGVRGLIMVVPHTFGRRLNFNSHLHTLVSAGGLRDSNNCWVVVRDFDKRALMRMWRFAVITYLREALGAQVLKSGLDDYSIRRLLTAQYERWWNIYVAHFTSKAQFLRYAGRYIRRLPIAQHRFVKITDHEIQFLRKDLKLKEWVLTCYSLADFIATLADHVPDRYRHAIRYFGLLAPGAKAQTGAALFALLGQEKRPRPRRLSWAASLQREFGRDPLVDSKGQRMHWSRRIAPPTHLI
jgi:Putative transposase/Transposase zinc-binding domain